MGDHGIDLAVPTATDPETAGGGATGQGNNPSLLREPKPRRLGPAIPLPPEIDAG